MVEVCSKQKIPGSIPSGEQNLFLFIQFDSVFIQFIKDVTREISDRLWIKSDIQYINSSLICTNFKEKKIESPWKAYLYQTQYYGLKKKQKVLESSNNIEYLVMDCVKITEKKITTSSTKWQPVP